MHWKTPLLLGTGTAIGILLTAVTGASAFDLPNSPPNSFSQVESALSQLEGDVNDAECGGWNFRKTADGKIANVSGVPGRDGDPFALIELGMAQRDERGEYLDDGFQFPNSSQVWGWTTACPPGFPPYYQDSSAATPCKNARECEKLCARINRWQFPLWACVTFDDEGNAHTTYLRKECEEHQGNNPRNEPAPPDGADDCDILTFIGWFYCCTGRLVTKMFYEQCTEGNPGACLNHPDADRNCIRCEGDGAHNGGGRDFNGERLGRGPALFNETGCRVGRAPSAAADPALDKQQINGRWQIIRRQYRSYFRKYIGASYQRDAVRPEVPQDNNAESGIPVLCFGRYTEFDPKLKRVVSKDKHCVLDIRGNPGIWMNNMQRTQKGKGSTGLRLNLLDPPLPKNATEGEMTYWRHDKIQDPDSEFSLLEMTEKYQRPNVQLTHEQMRSSGALIRAFDETVATDPIDPALFSNLKRTLVEWWQEQQTQGNTLFSPPSLRLILPPTWSIDLDPLHPLLSPTPPEEEMEQWKANPLLQPIEVQLEVREDLLGEVAEFLENSLLIQVEQEKIPVAVPLGSSTELRAMREGWCHWYKYQNQEQSCEDAGGDLGNLLERLKQYAERIDDYRTLRAQTATYLAKYLDMHNTINRNIGRWVLNNAQIFSTYLQQTSALAPLQTEWRKVQQAYRKFHDETNFLWCRNDRFTTPIYSLLDPWMPGRPSLRNDSSQLPTFQAQRVPDLVFDVTRLTISTGSVKIPILDPIQVSYDADGIRPPLEYNPNPAIPKLPELPPIPSIAEDVEDRIAEVEVGNDIPDLIRSPADPNIDINGLKQKMQEIRKIIENMEKEYRKFWNTLERVRNASELDCPKPNSGRCVHVEMDLIERFTRIGARPAVLLKQDFLSIGKFRSPAWVEGYDTCPYKDWSCFLLNPEYVAGKRGWHIEHPDAKEQERFTNTLRVEMVQQSLLRSINLQKGAPEILPSFDNPVELQIYPLRTADSGGSP